MEDALADLPPPANGAPVPTPVPDEAASPGPFLALGLGNWSSTLYHDPAASNAHD